MLCGRHWRAAIVRRSSPRGASPTPRRHENNKNDDNDESKDGGVVVPDICYTLGTCWRGRQGEWRRSSGVTCCSRFGRDCRRPLQRRSGNGAELSFSLIRTFETARRGTRTEVLPRAHRVTWTLSSGIARRPPKRPRGRT